MRADGEDPRSRGRNVALRRYREIVDFKEEAGTVDKRGNRVSIPAQHEPAARGLAEEVACLSMSTHGGVLVVGINDRDVGGRCLRGRPPRRPLAQTPHPRSDHAQLLDRRAEEVIVAGVRLYMINIPDSLSEIRVGGKLAPRFGTDCRDPLDAPHPARRLEARPARRRSRLHARRHQPGFSTSSPTSRTSYVPPQTNGQPSTDGPSPAGPIPRRPRADRTLPLPWIGCRVKTAARGQLAPGRLDAVDLEPGRYRRKERASGPQSAFGRVDLTSNANVAGDLAQAFQESRSRRSSNPASLVEQRSSPDGSALAVRLNPRSGVIDSAPNLREGAACVQWVNPVPWCTESAVGQVDTGRQLPRC